jgi:2-(1,2-epoxy-1,2-dihydrophenyl)acetyl-CoA isomerase
MSDAEFQEILFAIEDGVGVLTLNQPQTLNATTMTMLAEIHRALDACMPDRGARCLLLAAAGRGFCSGANLISGPAREVASGGEIDGGQVLEEHYNPLFLRLRSFPLPIVAAVQGPCAGVGPSLALAADLVVAARSAYFLQSFRKIALVPDGGATWLLPRLVGKARAMELGLMGDRLPAETALKWGLINRMVEDEALADEGRALARNLADGPTVALGIMRKLFWDSLENDYETQLKQEAQSQREAGKTADFREGVKAFTEKREPVFTGR